MLRRGVSTLMEAAARSLFGFFADGRIGDCMRGLVKTGCANEPSEIVCERLEWSGRIGVALMGESPMNGFRRGPSLIGLPRGLTGDANEL